VPRVSRTTGLILAIAASIVLSKLVIENVLGVDLATLVTRWAGTAGTGTVALVFALLAIDILLPVPSSLVMILSGSLLGVFWGSVVSLAGSLGGQIVGYELARRYGCAAATRLIGDQDLRPTRDLMARHGAVIVLATRALPVVLETVSVVAGLAGMARSRFLIAALAGTAPIVLVYAYAGAVAQDTGNLVPAVMILVAIGATGWIVTRRQPAR
jgi:uncharacterized membrane protein YdjX (TVP38/TMEM64 family)